MHWKNLIAFVTAFPLFIVLASCKTSQNYVLPGIQPIEESLISSAYYWDSNTGSKQFSDEEVRALFSESLSINPEDGERAELFASQLVWALTAIGDDHFAQLLKPCSKEVHDQIGISMDGLWSFHKMTYPRTQALLGKDGKGEQGGAG